MGDSMGVVLILTFILGFLFLSSYSDSFLISATPECNSAYEFRTINGTCNNLEIPFMEVQE